MNLGIIRGVHLVRTHEGGVVKQKLRIAYKGEGVEDLKYVRKINN